MIHIVECTYTQRMVFERIDIDIQSIQVTVECDVMIHKISGAKFILFFNYLINISVCQLCIFRNKTVLYVVILISSMLSL